MIKSLGESEHMFRQLCSKSLYLHEQLKKNFKYLSPDLQRTLILKEIKKVEDQQGGYNEVKQD